MAIGMSALFGLSSIFAANPPPKAGDAGGLAALGAGMMVFMLVYLAVIIVMVVALWKIFTKAGQPGWAAIVPIYNTYILMIEICKMEMLWFILSFVPFVNIVAGIMATLKLAEKFGKEIGFAIGLILLPFVFLPILAFGSAEYEGGGKKKYKPKFEDEEEEEEEEDEDEEERPRKKRR
jgi:hypothetical protein